MNRLAQILTFTFLFLFIFSVVPLSAQQKTFAIKSFEMDPFDVTAQSKGSEKIDGSGDRFAIIKVVSTDPNDQLLDYHFNFGFMKSLTEMHDGQLWVYVQKNAKHVTISRDGYKTLYKQDLKTTLLPGVTYMMTVAPNRADRLGVMYQQMVLFDMTPKDAGAVVLVTKEGGSEDLFGVQDETGAVAKSLPFGTYSYKVRAGMYKMSEGRFTLDNRTETYIEKVVLQANFSMVSIMVDADADIYVNGMLKGHRNWTGKLEVGDYQVECRQENHKSSFRTITVLANQTFDFVMTPPAANVGMLSVTSNPLGADILIDGVIRGVTPMNIVDVTEGSHNLVLKKEGYQLVEDSFDIKENQVVNLHLELQNLKNEEPEMVTDVKLDEDILWVDLGLSVLWASHNVGASKPEEYGDYFAWGEIEQKIKYTEGNSLTFSEPLQSIAGDVHYDAAAANWGVPARMPTKEEFEELINNTITQWVSFNKVKGRLVTSKKNGKSIFLPAAGYRRKASRNYAKDDGYYWSSVPCLDDNSGAYALGFGKDNFGQGWLYRYGGHSIRPVCDK